MKNRAYKCLSCGIVHKHVECEGLWHCPNALCRGVGAAWFRRKLESYEEVDHMYHTVDENEWLVKGATYNKAHGINRDTFVSSTNSEEKATQSECEPRILEKTPDDT